VAGEAFEALPSPSGRLIYYSAWGGRDGPLLRRLRWFVNAAADGKQLFTLDTPKDWTAGTTTTWAPDESGLDYVVTRNGVSNVWRQPLTRDSPVQLTHFTTSEIFGFAWSPDAKWLSLSGGTNRSDVVLLSRER
jgi:Tol biopolymer transport system component